MVTEMLENLTLLRTASAMARHATARTAVIAQNIAHADTPGYRARDVEPFDAALARPGAGAGARRPEIRTLDLPASPNGNSVSLEDQAVRAAAAQAQYDLALTIFSKGLDLIRVSLGRGR